MRPIYWVLIGLFVVGYVVVRMVLHAGARVSALREWADRNGYTFEPGKDASIGRTFAALTRLTRYQNCSATNVVRGPLGRYKFCAFDFADLAWRRGRTYRRGQPSGMTSFAAVVVETDLNLPPVVIERETVSAKVAKAFGADEVRVGSEEFDRKFMVRSPDHTGALAVLSPAVQQLLTDTPPFEFESSLETLELNGSLVLARSRSDQFFTERDYPEVLELLSALLAAVTSADGRAAGP